MKRRHTSMIPASQCSPLVTIFDIHLRKTNKQTKHLFQYTVDFIENEEENDNNDEEEEEEEEKNGKEQNQKKKRTKKRGATAVCTKPTPKTTKTSEIQSHQNALDAVSTETGSSSSKE